MELTPKLLATLNRLRGRHLALLVALHRERSVHKAARVISTSQPAATKMLREIEALFGVPLFERLPRSTIPTELGEAVARFARVAILDLRHLLEDLETFRSGRRGHIRVGAIMAAVPRAIGGAVARMRSSYPGITIDVRIDTSDVLVRDLLAGDLDVALGRLTTVAERRALAWERLDDEQLRIVARPRHPLVKAKSLALARLAKSAWVLQAPPSPTRHLIDREFERAGLDAPVVAAQSASFLATVAMLGDTDLLAVMPETIARDFEKQGKVAVLPVRFKSSLEPYGILTLKDRAPSTSLALFVESVRAAAGRDA